MKEDIREGKGHTLLRILVNTEESVYHVYHVARLFYPYRELSVRTDIPEQEAHIRVNVSVHEIVIDGCASDESSNGKYSGRRIYSIPSGVDKEDIKRSLYSYLSDVTGTTVPWGTLVGVRPVKIADRMMAEGRSDEEIRDFYRKNYLTSDAKVDMAVTIARGEKEILGRISSDAIGVYIHMPFCPSRCTYCSFLSIVEGFGIPIETYVETLLKDIEDTGKAISDLGLSVEMVYFGGGTPTVPDDDTFERILSAVEEHILRKGNIREYTVECGRPDTLSEGKFQSMVDHGVTRISINPQTFSNETLRRIGRDHTVDMVVDSFHEARALGLDDINMDIILGLPGEDMEDLRRTLKGLESLSPESITVHCLSVKKGAKLKDEYVPESMDMSEAIALVEDSMKRMGYSPYYLYRQKNIQGNGENVGYSKKGHESIYNIAMIEDTHTIVSCGAGAITKAVLRKPMEEHDMIERESSYKDIGLYLEKYHEVMENKIRLLKIYKESLN